jgi:thiamine monophosphate kinase
MVFLVVNLLFTAPKNKRRIIKKISHSYKIKLTQIGSIHSITKKSSLIDDKKETISFKNKGYIHQF